MLAGIILFLVGFTLGMGLISILNVSKISYLEDELYKENMNNISLQKLFKDIKKHKIEPFSKELDDTIIKDCILKIESHLSYIIGVTSSERILAECNLIQTEIDYIKKGK